MNYIKAILIGIMTVATAGIAQAGASAGLDVTDAYIFRGGTINDEVNVQPTLEATVEEGALAGLTLGTWANFNTDSEQFDEIDYYASYAIPLGEEKSASIGYTEYTYPNSTTSTTTGLGTGVSLTTVSATEADREISLSAGGVCPVTGADLNLGVFYGLDGAIDEQVYIQLDAGKGTDVCDEATLEGGITAGFIANQADGSTADEGVSYVQLSLGTTIMDLVTASVNYVIETDDAVLVVDEDLFFSVGAGIEF